MMDDHGNYVSRLYLQGSFLTFEGKSVQDMNEYELVEFIGFLAERLERCERGGSDGR
jgi:hypothetical protein